MGLVNLIGAALIGLIIWWFWLYKPRETSINDDNLIVTVENGSYFPAHIKLPKNQAAVITFLRKDPSPCAEVVMIPKLDINETLPLDKPISIEIPGLKAGEYAFHCQMQMYRGVLNVG